ncbi:hypothetical protein ACP0HM_15580 [Escherichia coli]
MPDKLNAFVRNDGGRFYFASSIPAFKGEHRREKLTGIEWRWVLEAV